MPEPAPTAPSCDDDDLGGLGDRLLTLGYERAEGGQRGAVFLPDDGSPHVVKAFPDDDLGYLSLVRYALDHPSPHFPRVLHGPVRNGDEGWVVVLERLCDPDAETSTYYLDEAEGFLLDVVNGDRDGPEARAGAWGEDLAESLRTALFGIGSVLLRDHGFIPDPSDGNVLMRDDVPVLADVVCGRDGRAYQGTSPPVHDEDFAGLLAGSSRPMLR